ncbi:hypothetical protein GMLC_14740 [Geomonas limicola]|uniref:DUF2730 domain-containing protein n=1 Tax=Geomonas limicola TaxID=2740186 RepID=A0A6V8N5P8_9BACT|nr:hypothetical protein [Geomonas limicola]GFO67895.1 hypothetical protein GMLC_14740 [Geomonas limicola]
MIGNLQPWMFAFSIFQFIYNVCLTIYLMRKDKDKVTSGRFKEIEDQVTRLDKEKVTGSRVKETEDRISKVETDLVKVEAKVGTAPVCGNHGRMEENDVKLFARFDELHGDIRELTGAVKGLTRSNDMINEFLLKERK